jgi:hypothetical protein
MDRAIVANVAAEEGRASRPVQDGCTLQAKMGHPGNRAAARAAVVGCWLTVSFAAAAQQGPASTQGPPARLPDLPPAASAPAAAATPAPATPTTPAPTPPAVGWAPSSTIEVRLDGHDLRIRAGASESVLDLGCAGRTSLQQGDRVFVACGADGVVEVDASNPLAPRPVGSMAVDGEATGLFAREGRVWVEIAHYSARPVRTDGGASGVVETPAPETASVETQRPTLLAPPRRGGIWELSAEAGAFVNLGPSSAGVVGWATAVYRFEAPLVVRLELAPIAFGAGRSVTTISTGATAPPTGLVGFNGASGSSSSDGSIGVGALQALVGIDTQFVEVAIGGGAATIGNSSSVSSTTGGASIAAEARFGARDGLAFTIESIVVGANGEFELASLTTTIQVPLTRSVMLIARGGGGNVGILYGDLGARVLLAGDGGKGTVALTGFFGGEGIDFQGCANTGVTSGPAETCPYASLGGPAIGGGIEWRR